MEAVGWKTGAPDISSGAGFGIKIRQEDRDSFFKHNWQTVRIRIAPCKTLRVSISKSFWGNCPELRSKSLGKWMFEKGIAPWPKSSPPKFRLEQIGDNLFSLSSL
jgi:hypothetical protein